jgi:hypothetical protein
MTTDDGIFDASTLQSLVALFLMRALCNYVYRYDQTYDSDEWNKFDKGSDGLDVVSYCAPTIEVLDVVEGTIGWEDNHHVAEVRGARVGLSSLAPRTLPHGLAD